MQYEYAEIAAALAEVLLSFSGVSTLLGLVSYVFCALPFYTIAQRRGIRNAWLAWIPVANVWILGSISDQYRYVVKGEIKSRRKVLLAVRLVCAVLSLFASVQVFATVIAAANQALHGAQAEVILRVLIRGFGSGLLAAVPMLVLKLVGTILEIMALYDVYTSCEPANNVLYLILSIIPGLGSITKPLFLFLSRNQDGGMPPRRENPEYR